MRVKLTVAFFIFLLGGVAGYEYALLYEYRKRTLPLSPPQITACTKPVEDDLGTVEDDSGRRSANEPRLAGQEVYKGIKQTPLTPLKDQNKRDISSKDKDNISRKSGGDSSEEENAKIIADIKVKVLERFMSLSEDQKERLRRKFQRELERDSSRDTETLEDIIGEENASYYRSMKKQAFERSKIEGVEKDLY
ncbi:MAG: hypothetical protein D6808_04190, partial [Candidatus Dadabacteria bacterium]